MATSTTAFNLIVSGDRYNFITASGFTDTVTEVWYRHSTYLDTYAVLIYSSDRPKYSIEFDINGGINTALIP